MLVGSHVSIAGGVQNAPVNAIDVGCETFQIFSKNQRQWNAKPYTDENIAGYRDAFKDSGCARPIVHDSYLINLGAPDPGVWQRSRDAFVDEMERCQALGIPFLNFHPGAHVGSGEPECIKRIAKSVADILQEQDDNPTVLLIENTAGQGSNVGYAFEHLAELLDRIDDPARTGICIDTQHTFAAGYDWCSENGYDEVWDAFSEVVGMKWLKAFHLNDSKAKLGSRVDRHENLGEGEIGWGLFERLVNDARFKGIPGVVETPGGPEVWRDEVASLKAFRGPKAPDPPKK
jgi:deoxyribonuclease IV